MGAYLSKPVTDKISADEENDKIKIGASSMQGWRESQEDAHNNLIDFDENAYFLAVYDGHGGREVALYCSQKLPQFIKNTEAYRNGDMENALIDGFLGFDATLTSEEVIAELRQLMSDSKDESNISDEENVNKLYEEATMPLDEVIEKYKAINKPKAILLKDGLERPPVSPYLRACKKSKGIDTTLKEKEQIDSAVTSSSEGVPCKDGALDQKNVDTSDVSDCKSKEEFNVDVAENSKPDTNAPPSLQGVSDNKLEVSEERNDKSERAESIKATMAENQVEVPENINKPTENHNEQSENGNNPTENDNITTSNKEVASDSKPQENGKISKKGKVLAKTKGIITPVKSVRPKRTALQLYHDLLHSESDESESEDEDDQTFQGSIEDSSSDDDTANIPIEVSEDSSDDIACEEDEFDESDDEEEEDDDDDHDDDIDLTDDVPGSSSGCTAVVALMHGTRLFVANAGDSRCIVCRNGTAIDLSVDHKPEDPEELQRITKAGGRVNFDGRVNGGLNLSRAIGDHSYKLNKDLPDKEQMITALPDIQSYVVTPLDEFMVLACDGIWNYMTSQEVADFVKCRLEKHPEKLSQICEELFDNCLASNTMGDGTGCDNMTAIIVNFKSGMFKRSAPAPSDDEESNNPKRAKTDDEHIVQQETAV